MTVLLLVAIACSGIVACAVAWAPEPATSVSVSSKPVASWAPGECLQFDERE